MHEKSISYEHVISSLIDACGLIDDRKEDISIKRSFTTKQTIFSDVLFRRLLSYLSGDDEKLSVTLNNLFEILEEVMKDMCSSPYLLNMNKKAFDNEFKTDLLIPFTAILLFNMRFDFKVTSPIYYFIDFLSKNSLNTTTPIDALSREYIKAKLKSCNIPDIIGVDFRNFIGKISLSSALKIKTIESKIDDLRYEYKCIDKNGDLNKFTELSLAMHGIRLVLIYRDHIGDLLCCYNHAKCSTAHKEKAYWHILNEIAKAIIIKKTKKNEIYYVKFNDVINKTKEFSDKFYGNLAIKHKTFPNDILTYMMDESFNRERSSKLLIKNKHLKNSIHYNMLDAFNKIYDGDFSSAKSIMSLIVGELDKHPTYRMGSSITKLFIAILIKENGSKIKNNSLDSYIDKAISADRSRIKLTSQSEICFFNQNSPFSNNPTFYTILDSIYEWHDFIRDMLKINVMQSSAHDIEFTSKIEIALNKIYIALEQLNVSLEFIEENELRKLVQSTLTTDERLENIITFIPGLTLYFALREIGYISHALSHRMMLKSMSIYRFIDEPIDSKKKLLKAISRDDFSKDEKSEASLEEPI